VFQDDRLNQSDDHSKDGSSKKRTPGTETSSWSPYQQSWHSSSTGWLRMASCLTTTAADDSCAEHDLHDLTRLSPVANLESVPTSRNYDTKRFHSVRVALGDTSSDSQIFSRAHFQQQKKPFLCLQGLVKSHNVDMLGKRQVYRSLRFPNERCKHIGTRLKQKRQFTSNICTSKASSSRCCFDKHFRADERRKT
jgi:hypothetical protein